MLCHRSGVPLSAAFSALPSAPNPALLLLAAASLSASDPVPLFTVAVVLAEPSLAMALEVGDESD